MDEARQAGQWEGYQREQREVQAAAQARDHAQDRVTHQCQQLRDQQRAFWHRPHEWDH
jgi:hypothetical protein